MISSCASKEKQVFNYPDGNVRIEGFYEKGTDKQVGTWKYYDESGRLKRVENYKGGKKNGQSLIYYESGNLKVKSAYKSGLLDGEYIQFYDTGSNKKKIEGTYKVISVDNVYGSNSTELSVKDGKWKYYNQNGNIDSIIVYQEVDDVYMGAEFIFSKENDTLVIDSVIKIDYIKKRL